MKIKYIELNLEWIVDTIGFWEQVKQEYDECDNTNEAILYHVCSRSNEFRNAWMFGGREKIRQYAVEFTKDSVLDCRLADTVGDLFLCNNESDAIPIRRAFIDYMVKEMAKPLNII